MTQSGVWRGGIALLVVAAATACSGQQEAAPPAPVGTTGTPSAADAPIPATTSPYDALPDVKSQD